MEKPCYRRRTPLVAGGTQTQVIADSMAIAASAPRPFLKSKLESEVDLESCTLQPTMTSCDKLRHLPKSCHKIIDL